MINSSDKILVIASLPEDIAIACGGFVCKYNKQVDLYCINREDTQLTYYGGFCKVAQKAGVNRIFIKKTDDFLCDTRFLNQSDLSDVNMKEYDLVLIPHSDDNNEEHRFLSKTLLKNMLEEQGCKDNLKILRYELWTPIKDATYYEDITAFSSDKKQLIMCYKSNVLESFADGIITNNKFRTFTSNLSGSAEYVEAFLIDDLSAYLEKPDVIDENTDKDFTNEEIEKFLNENDADRKINDLAEQYQGKKVAIYGAGDYARGVFKRCDLSKLDIIAIADKRFEQSRKHEFYGLKCISPQELVRVDADVILVADKDYVKTYDFLTKTILKGSDVEIAPLIKIDLGSIMNINTEDKICTRPFHTLSIVSTGHCITCCPAYINNYVIGNVYSNNLNDIWNGKRAKHLRKSLLNGDYTNCDLKTCIHLELNDKKKLSEYYDGNLDNIKLPDTIYMGWDLDCNVACITCRNQIIKNDEESLKNMQAIENSVLEACKNAKYFYTSGNGDPFGSSHARGIIKKIVEINPEIRFLIHTNGILFTKNMSDELGITDKIKSVTISIHAACKETYDKIVRYGNFEKVMQNLEWLSEMKKEGKIEGITLVFVVHKLNYKDMPDFVRVAEKYDAIASFRYYRQWSNNTEYDYKDMAVFEDWHPEHSNFVNVLRDSIFDSPHCSLDPSLMSIHKSK